MRWFRTVPGLRAGLAVATLIAIGSTPTPAWAQGAGSAAAEALFQQGREALDAGDLQKACGLFKDSVRIERTPGTIYNLADCEEKRGKIATAWQLFGEVVARLPAGDSRRQFAADRQGALTSRLPKIVLKATASTPEGTTVQIGEAKLSSSSFGQELPVDPGRVTLVVSAPDREPNTVEISLAEGERREIPVAVGSKVEAPVGAPPETLPPPPPGVETSPEPDSGGGSTLPGWVTVGVGGAVLLGVGGTFGLLALQKRSENDDHCDDLTCDQAGLDAASAGKTFQVVSVIGMAAGAVGVGVGVYLLMSSEDGEGDMAVVAAPTAGGGYLGLRGRL